MNTPSLTWLLRRALRCAVLFVLLFLVLPLALSAQEPGGGEPAAPPAQTHPPTITSVSASLGVLNHPFFYQIEATAAPTRFDATGLPSGLNVDPDSGLISGTPTTPGVFEVTLSATNNFGPGTAALTLTVGTVTTVAAGPPLNNPCGMTFDWSGRLVVGNYGGAIVRISSFGYVSVLASGSTPAIDVAYDGSGNLYVSNYWPEGFVSKYNPGWGRTVFASGINHPVGLAFDRDWNLYVNSAEDYTVRKITPEGAMSLFSSGPLLYSPAGMAFDRAGDLFVANQPIGTVVKISPDGSQAPFASGLVSPWGVVFDQVGTLYVASTSNGTVYKVTPSGRVYPVATGFSGPSGLSIDAAGALYVANYYAHSISRVGFVPVTITSVGSTLAVVNQAFRFQVEATGAPTSYTCVGLPYGMRLDSFSGVISGTPTSTGVYGVALTATNRYGSANAMLTITVGAVNPFASIDSPTALVFDALGDLVVGTGDGKLYKVTPAGAVSLWADGFDDIRGLAYDAEGILYVASYSQGAIWRLPSEGPGSVFVDNLGGGVHGLAFDRAGDLYYSSQSDFMIHKIAIAPSGEAGAISVFAQDSPPFLSPAGMAFDRNGDLFVAILGNSAGNGRVCKVTPAGVVTTFASSVDFITAVAFDASGTLYLSNYAYGAIDCVSPSGILEYSRFTCLGAPRGIAFDAAGALYVADPVGNTISRICLPPPVITSPTTAEGTYGQFFRYIITATNQATAYSAEGLPSGLTFNPATGDIQGVPGQIGTFTIDLGAANSTGMGFAVLELKIEKAPAVVTLGNLIQEYDRSPKPVTVTTNPPGLAVAVTYTPLFTPPHDRRHGWHPPVPCTTAPSALGSYTVKATITDANYVGSATGTLRIVDTTPPVITRLFASPATLWPANHQMATVTLRATATDAAGRVTVKIIAVTSSEPDSGLGRGDKPHDIEIIGALKLNLRAERSDRGDGRTYTITVEATDDAGNASTKTVKVFVPVKRGDR